MILSIDVFQNDWPKNTNHLGYELGSNTGKPGGGEFSGQRFIALAFCARLTGQGLDSQTEHRGLKKRGEELHFDAWRR